MVSDKYDFVIVGGGMAGATMALLMAPLLEKHNKRLLILEAFDPRGKDYIPSFDARSSALSEGTRRVLDDMGVWQSIAQKASPIEHIHVSQKSRFGVTRIAAQECNLSAMGYVVENSWFGHCLLDAISQQSHVEWRAPARVKQLSPKAQETSEPAKGYRIELDDGALLEAEFVMVADGANSQLRDMLGIQSSKQPYHQHALICNVKTHMPHQQVAYERFTPDGPLALLPLTDNRSALIWSVPDDQIEERMAMSDRAFQDKLQQEFGSRLGPLIEVGERACYPLNLMLVTEQVRSGLVLLGNSAHALHPVAGQGFNLIMRDLVALTESIEACLEQGTALQQLQWLSEYQQQRQLDQWLTTSFSHWLIEIFCAESSSLEQARQLGLILLDRIPFAKQLFAKQAMGMGVGSNLQMLGGRG